MKVFLIIASLVLSVAVMAGDFPAGSPRFASSLTRGDPGGGRFGQAGGGGFLRFLVPCPCQTMKNEVLSERRRESVPRPL